MGRHAVLVHRSGAFIDRVVEAARAKGLALQGGLVHYFDPHVFSGNMEHPVFAKRSGFSWQREYRLAIDCNAASPEPFVLDVGPIGDLCTIVDSAALREVTVLLPG
jgi:hypothetical protein